MKKIAAITLSILLLALLPGLFAEAAEAAKPTSPASEFTIDSPALGWPLTVEVSLPESYEKGDKAYGVVYYTDSNAFRGLVSDLALNLGWDGDFPELITVGIRLSTTDREQHWLGRTYTFTPTKSKDMAFANVPKSSTGGGPELLRVIREVIIPRIEATYRTKPGERTLMGHSLGGLFCFYVLYEEPGLFNRFIASAPFVSYDDDLIKRLDDRYTESHDSLPVSLYVGWGSLDPPDLVKGVEDYLKQLQDRHYRNFHLKTQVWADQTHNSGPFLTFTAGLRFVYAGEVAEPSPL